MKLPRFRQIRSRIVPTKLNEQRLGKRVAALEEAVEENRKLNQRLADVVDVVTELLVPAMDRDDERVKKALADLGKTLDAG